MRPGSSISESWTLLRQALFRKAVIVIDFQVFSPDLAPGHYFVHSEIQNSNELTCYKNIFEIKVGVTPFLNNVLKLELEKFLERLMTYYN